MRDLRALLLVILFAAFHAAAAIPAQRPNILFIMVDDWKLDGINILPLLEGKTNTLTRDTLYWRFGVQYAVRQGDWKLVKAGLHQPVQLFNLKTDRNEQNDLAKSQPEKVKALQMDWDAWNTNNLPPRWEDPRWNTGNNKNDPENMPHKNQKRKRPQ